MTIEALTETNQDIVVELQERLQLAENLSRFIFKSSLDSRERYWQEPGLLLAIEEPAYQPVSELSIDASDNDTFTESVLSFLAEQSGQQADDIIGPGRKRELVSARHAAFYLLRQHTDMSFPVIGKLIGGRDHTTVIHGVERFETAQEDSEHGISLTVTQGTTRKLIMAFNEHYEQMQHQSQQDAADLTPEAYELAHQVVHTCLTTGGLFSYNVETLDDPAKLRQFGWKEIAPLYLDDTRSVYDELVERYAASAFGLLRVSSL